MIKLKMKGITMRLLNRPYKLIDKADMLKFLKNCLKILEIGMGFYTAVHLLEYCLVNSFDFMSWFVGMALMYSAFVTSLLAMVIYYLCQDELVKPETTTVTV
jgi:hypothetical protein